jgi:hypothetical protein
MRFYDGQHRHYVRASCKNLLGTASTLPSSVKAKTPKGSHSNRIETRAKELDYCAKIPGIRLQ